MVLLHPLSMPRLALYQYADVRPSDSVLDIGTGAGFAAVARCVLGIDISEPIIAIASGAIPTSDVGRVRFECTDVGDPTFVSKYEGCFDLVTSSDVFEHVHDPDAFVHTISRVLRPDGRAVLTFPNETAGHGVTRFPSSADLVALFNRHGLIADLRVLKTTGWANMVHQVLWRRPLMIFRRHRRTYGGQTEQPQVMHETWYGHVAASAHPIFMLINAYARIVEALMLLGGPIYRAYVVRTPADIADQRVLLRVRKA